MKIKNCCEQLRALVRTGILCTGKSTKMPQLQTTKYVLRYLAEPSIVELCPAYMPAYYCPNCGVKLK